MKKRWGAWTKEVGGGRLDWDTPVGENGQRLVEVIMDGWLNHSAEAVDAWNVGMALAQKSTRAWGWVPDLPAHQQPSVLLFWMLTSPASFQLKTPLKSCQKLFGDCFSTSDRRKVWEQVFQAQDSLANPENAHSLLGQSLLWWNVATGPYQNNSNPHGPLYAKTMLGLMDGDEAWVLARALERLPRLLELKFQVINQNVLEQASQLLSSLQGGFKTPVCARRWVNTPEIRQVLGDWMAVDEGVGEVLAHDAVWALWSCPELEFDLNTMRVPTERAWAHRKAMTRDFLERLGQIKKEYLDGCDMEKTIDVVAARAIETRFPEAVERWRSSTIQAHLDEALPPADRTPKPRM